MNDLVIYLAGWLIGVMFVSCAWSEHQEELRTTPRVGDQVVVIADGVAAEHPEDLVESTGILVLYGQDAVSRHALMTSGLTTLRAGARGLMVDQLDGLHGKQLVKIHVDSYEYWSIGDYFKRSNR